MEIEYLDIFRRIEGNKSAFYKWEKLWKESLLREDLIDTFSFAIPTEEAINGIIKYSPIIEIGAGKGYWVYLINKYGGKIIAFDDFSYFIGENKILYKNNFWFNVQKGNERMVKKYPNHTLFLCWIDSGSDFGYKTLKWYKGKYFIHIGEDSEEGCTANDKFYRYLHKNFKRFEGFYIPQWYGVHDYLNVFERIK